MSAIRALFDKIDAATAAREARIERRLVLWHHLREQALQAENEAFYQRRKKWEMADLGVMPGELRREPDWNGHKEEAAWRRRASLWEQSWVLAARLHADGVRDPTDGCNCDGCKAWGADHAATYAQENWAYRPALRRYTSSAEEMREVATLVVETAEENRQDPAKTWERKHVLWQSR